MDYLPITPHDKQKMLEKIGIKSSDELFLSIPFEKRIKEIGISQGVSEQTLIKMFENTSNKNVSLKDFVNYMGAGMYEHFIPSLVDEIVNRSEFATAYTPYQPEASQGTLQVIFEYQSLIVELTGMDIANASLYDGASAVAEAALLAIRTTNRKKILVSEALHPEYNKVLETYLQGSETPIIMLPIQNGQTSHESLKKYIDNDCAAIIIQSPNFLGTIEDLDEIRALSKKQGVLLIQVVNPISLGILKSPGEIGSDIAVGEGQVLGNAPGFGGITFGFFAAQKELSWKIPGRVVGQTIDKNGNRGFVLTLQSREQHIRREKATSNICTNAALNALAGCVYLAGWGPDGMKRLAEANLQNSHYAYEQIIKIPGFGPAFKNANFFNEFCIKTTKAVELIQKKLLAHKILGPLHMGRFYKDLNGCLLFCVTETKTKKEIDTLIDVLKSI